LSRHRDREPVLGFDEVVLAVVADVDLYPVDLAVEFVVGGAVVGPELGHLGRVSLRESP
jgi:hypothetical protein